MNTKVVIIHLVEGTNVSTKFNGRQFNSFWDILLKATHFNLMMALEESWDHQNQWDSSSEGHDSPHKMSQQSIRKLLKYFSLELIINFNPNSLYGQHA